MATMTRDELHEEFMEEVMGAAGTAVLPFAEADVVFNAILNHPKLSGYLRMSRTQEPYINMFYGYDVSLPERDTAAIYKWWQAMHEHDDSVTVSKLKQVTAGTMTVHVVAATYSTTDVDASGDRIDRGGCQDILFILERRG